MPNPVHWRLALSAAALLAGLAGLVALARPGLLPIDGLSATFLVALGLVATADPAPTALPRLLGAAACTVAPDALLLVLGYELAVLRAPRAMAGSVPLLGAAALLGGFAATRAHPPPGMVAVAILLLATAGVAQRTTAASPSVSVAGLYVLARTMELCGPGVPGWWGLSLLAAGTGLAALAAWRAVGADVLPEVALRLFQSGLGLALAALGTLAAARASDLTELAGVAASGFVVLLLAQSAGLAVLAAAARAVAAGAGTLRLPGLGGLAATMPRASLGLAVGAASLALLPPGGGFAGAWLVAQATLGLPRGGLPGLVVALSAASGGLALGCAAASVLRLLATACLGRPRLPRSSAAADRPGARGAAPAAAGVLLAVAGVAAGPALVALAAPVRLLSGATAAPAWGPPALAALLAVLAPPAAWLGRGRPVAPWADGRGPPPPWLPFGDPAEQWSAAGFAAPFRIAVRRPDWPVNWPIDWPVRWSRSWPRPIREAGLLAILLAVALLFLHP